MSKCTKCKWLHHHDGCRCCSCRDDEIAELESALAAYRWIPVSEKPKTSMDVLICYKENNARFIRQGGYNHISYVFKIYGSYKQWTDYQRQITHWMPIPPLPEKGGE